MDLLHDLPVDPIAHAKEPIAIDPMDGSRQDGGDARRSAVDPRDRNRGPGPTSAIAPQAPPRRLTDPINMSR